MADVHATSIVDQEIALAYFVTLIPKILKRAMRMIREIINITISLLAFIYSLIIQISSILPSGQRYLFEHAIF